MDNKIKKIFKLTPMQEGMLFHRLADENSTSYHNQNGIWLEEKIDFSDLQNAVKVLVMKHEALTAAFVVPQATGIPRQVFFENRDIECTYLEVDAKNEEAYIEIIKEEDFKRGFNLQNESLFRLKLINFANSKKSLLLFSHHHIIMDGWCMSLISGDLMRYYSMLSEGLSYEEVIQIASEEKRRSSKYFEYLQWLEKKDRNEALLYWRKLLDGYDSVADLIPVDEPKETYKSVDALEISFDKDEIKKIRNGAISNNITINTIFEATWGLTLQKYNYTNDVVFGKVVSGRDVPISGIEDTVGLFINTIPCRVRSEEKMTIHDLLKELHIQSAESSRHDHCPLVDIQRETQQKSDLLKTLMVFENADNYDEIRVNEESSIESTNFNLNFGVYINQGKLLCKIIYNPKRYSKNEMEALLLRVKKIALFVVSNISSLCSEVNFITDFENKLILEEFNYVHETNVEHLTLNSLFEEQVRLIPNKIAVVFDKSSMTYLELNSRANAIASKLREIGIKKGDKVALITNKGLEAIIGVLSIVKAGAAYVPIDSAYPEKRKKFVLKDCEPKALLIYGQEIKSDIPTINLSEEITELYENPPIVNNASDLAYVIYTSGTGGQPKGVMVNQKNIITLIQDADYIPINSETVLLQTGHLAFDASTFEIWGTLINGGELHLSKEDAILEIPKLKKYITAKSINTMFITTALFNQIISDDVTVFDTLTYLLFGGEKASEKHVRYLKEHNKTLDLRNIYGPTECTTFATYFKINNDFTKLPIGKPRVNTQTYVMADNKLCGIGILGELCIAGDGVACGYLNRDKLTKEKFIMNPFGKGKLYKTGDLVRWLSDGNIEYIGRIDEQVKIRGFRIELGDIESAIREIDKVKDVVVIDKKSKLGEVYLNAYVVREVQNECIDIKEELSDLLPEYMIPNHIMFIDMIPVNGNGKIDKGALPEIKNQSKKQYISTRNEIEYLLVEIFKEVLGLEKVSVIDNFFELGGDSIKAIRITSKLRAKNYEITVKDIMQGHTVEKIAKRAKKVGSNNYQQGEVIGKVISTPIIKKFFNKKLARPSHYNQSIMIRIDCDDINIIAQVMDSITQHHDILRAVIRDETLIVLPFSENKGYDLCALDFSGDNNAKDKIEKACTDLQSSILLEEGPLMKTALITTDEGNFFFMAIHHLIVDGVSWRIIMEDIYTAFSKIEKNMKISFQSKTSSFIMWAKELEEYKKTDKLQKEKDYWQGVVSNMEDEFVEKYDVTGENVVNSITIDIDENHTNLLLYECHKAYNTQINDILLAALTPCVSTVLKKKRVTVGLEGHGREEIHKKIDISRTVGWFTTIYPVNLKEHKNMADNIIETKETLRRVPNKGLGYGLLEPEFGCKEINILFNYLGDMDAEDNSNNMSVPYSTGLEVALENEDIKLAVDCMVKNHKLIITIMYNKKYIQSETAVHFMEEYKKYLRDVIDYCVSRKENVKTLSDLTGELQNRDKEIINTIYSDEEIEDIYELTPVQEGMFYYTEVDKSSTVYIIQNLYNIKGSLDIDTFKKAIHIVAMKNEVLRTVFLYKKLSSPLQVVLKDYDTEIDFIDMCNYRKAKVDCEVEILINEDLKRGFDLASDSLMRIKIVRIDSFTYKVLFTMHHIIIDGWSLSILLGDIFKYYSMLNNNISIENVKQIVESEKQQVARYSDYISWIHKQNLNKGLNYWIEVLKDYDEIAEITPLNSSNESGIQMKSEKIYFSASETRSIIHLGTELNVTSNTIIETLWGIVLQKYNYTNDVVFGKVVSGRNADVLEIEKMVGMFINTIPVRVTATDNSRVVDLLKSVQLQGDDSLNYCYCPLSDIQDRMNQGNDLIKSIIVFENYYVDNHMNNEQDTLSIELAFDREQLNYPISLLVAIENGVLEIASLYNPNEFDENEITLLLERLKIVLMQMINDPYIKVKEIELITEQEKNLIMGDFNNTSIDYDRNLVLMDYFEEQVKKTPNETAVVFQNKEICYLELNKKANILAWKLRSVGIGVDDFVIIMAKHSIEMIVALLAVLKSGAAYVPIDCNYPEERKKYILNDCKAKAVITYGIDEKTNMSDAIIIRLEDCFNEDTQNELNPSRNNLPSNLAYCFYTSGTTGKPKGVMVEQRSLVNFVQNNQLSIMYEAFKNDYKKILSVTNYTFDIFFTETILALINGMTVYMSNEEERRMALPFSQLCERHQLEILQTTPSKIASLLVDKRSYTGFKTLKLIIIGGEKLEKSIVDLLAKCTDAIIMNVYGPTEATVWATSYLIDTKKDNKNISIGSPLANIKVYVLNGTKLCGIGIPGELCIGGDAVARGYLNREKITKEKFIKNPFDEGIIYRTGDIARWGKDGNIAFEGRKDDQVKINGVRIELGEIDSVLRSISYIMDCAVVVKKDGTGENAICAYIVSDSEINMNKTRKLLKKELQDYMVPQYIQQIDSLPMTTSGKLDKKALPLIDMKVGKAYVPAKTEIEKQLCQVFEEVLNLKQVGRFDNFYELGGNSLKSVRVISRMEERGYKITLQDLMSKETVVDICKGIDIQAHQENRYIENLYNSSYKISYNTKKEDEISQKNRLNYVINLTKEGIRRYEKDILMNAEYEEYPLTSIQSISYTMGVRKFAMQIPLYEEVDLCRLNQSWEKVQWIYDILKSSILINKGKNRIRIYKGGETTIPYVDISMLDEYHKRQYMLELVKEADSFEKDSYYTAKHLSLKVVLVKLAAKTYSLFISCSHLIADAYSSEIIKNRLMNFYNNVDEELVKLSYESSYKILSNQRMLIAEEEAMDFIEIIPFLEKYSEFCDNYNKEGYESYLYEYNSKEWSVLTEEEKLLITQKTFIKALQYNFPNGDIPICILRMCRSNKDFSLHSYVGEFLDLVPIIIPNEFNGTVEELSADKISYLEQNNVFLAPMVYSEEADNLLGIKQEDLSNIIIYNNTGVLGNKEYTLGEQKLHHSGNIMDVDIYQNGFCMNLLVQGERERNIKECLDAYVNKMVIEKCYV